MDNAEDPQVGGRPRPALRLRPLLRAGPAVRVPPRPGGGPRPVEEPRRRSKAQGHARATPREVHVAARRLHPRSRPLAPAVGTPRRGVRRPTIPRGRFIETSLPFPRTFHPPSLSEPGRDRSKGSHLFIDLPFPRRPPFPEFRRSLNDPLHRDLVASPKIFPCNSAHPAFFKRPAQAVSLSLAKPAQIHLRHTP